MLCVRRRLYHGAGCVNRKMVTAGNLKGDFQEAKTECEQGSDTLVLHLGKVVARAWRFCLSGYSSLLMSETLKPKASNA